MDTRRQVGLCRAVKGDGNQLRITQQEKHKAVKFRPNGMLPKGGLFHKFTLDYRNHFIQMVKMRGKVKGEGLVMFRAWLGKGQIFHRENRVGKGCVTHRIFRVRHVRGIDNHTPFFQRDFLFLCAKNTLPRGNEEDFRKGVHMLVGCGGSVKFYTFVCAKFVIVN